METLADAYLRAAAYVRDTPMGLGAALELMEHRAAEWRTLFSRLGFPSEVITAYDATLEFARAKYAARPPDTRDADAREGDRAIRLALDAISEVNRQWWQSDAEHPPSFAVDEQDDAAKAHATATWAADVIARASYPRVKVDPLPGPGELTLAGCVAWLEAFADGLQRALRPTVAMPGQVLNGLLDLRAQGTVGSARRSPTAIARAGDVLARDRTFRTFAVGDLAHWRLTSTRAQLAFDLPFEGASPRETRQRGAAGVRAVLTGPLLRAYTATWALFDAWTRGHGGSNPHGLFELDLDHVLGDLYGHTRVPNTVNGKVYSRWSPSARKAFAEAFDTLRLSFLDGIGTITASPPEALVTRYFDTASRREVYRHAPLAMLALGRYYVQVPREVLRLDPHDTPLGLGLARGLHAKARTILRGPGHLRCTLAELARLVGAPVEEGARSRRAAIGDAWARFGETAVRVTREGALGALRVEGEGPKALVTLTPSEALGSVYSALAAPAPARTPPSPTPARRRARPRRAP